MTSRRVAFPPVGNWTVIVEGYLRALGVDVVPSPDTTRRTLDLGVTHCPEMLCAPCKLLFGNYLKAAECGADTIVALGRSLRSLGDWVSNRLHTPALWL